MTVTTRTAQVQQTWAPPQQTAQVGKGAVLATNFGATTTFFDCSAGSQFSVTLTASGSVMSAYNPLPGQSIDIYLKQDGTGSRTVSWDSWLWAAQTAPTLSTTATTTDVIRGTYNDVLGKWIGTSVLNISST